MAPRRRGHAPELQRGQEEPASCGVTRRPWITASYEIHFRRRVGENAPYGEIVEALREGFHGEIVTPVRHHHETSAVSTLLLMPAWSRAFTGLKTVVVKSDNAAKGLPTITASYLLIDNDTGATVAMIDGTELTRRRTAAASALAAYYLARPMRRRL